MCINCKKYSDYNYNTSWTEQKPFILNMFAITHNPANLCNGRPANNYHPWMILYNNKYPNFSIICTEDNRRMVSTYMGTFELVGFDATHEERMTLRQSLHEQLK